VQSGRSENDIVDGRSFIRDPASRAIQEQFIPYAAAHLALLRDVLHHSSDAEHRAIAAQIIAYAPDVRAVIRDLIDAQRDPSPNVRNDATRALLIIAAYAQQHPEAGIHVPAESFVALLGSPYWTDRNKSSGALAELTANRDPLLLKTLRSHALRALIEMAHWKLIGYASPSLRILGRIGGMSDDAIERAIDRGDREAIIASAKRR
jgi:HEAT repeat protein